MAESKTATEGQLGELHQKVAKVMINALDQVIKYQEEDPVTDKESPQELNPALLSVMVRFLDANKITCAPVEGSTMSELEQKLAAKKQKRRQVGNVVHLEQDD